MVLVAHRVKWHHSFYHCPPFSQAEMAVLKLITLAFMQLSRLEWSTVTVCSHCHPFSHAEVTALKLITLGILPMSRIF